jgi:uncharacterized protein YcbK (DUF882 family)
MFRKHSSAPGAIVEQPRVIPSERRRRGFVVERRSLGGQWIAVGSVCRLTAGILLAAASVAGLVGTGGSAIADGGTRSLSFYHTHTGESATVTFRRNGSYDPEGLRQLNWLLRDWRVNEAAKMDPLLFDVLWEVYRESGSREPIHVISAYRSPQTNAMLRRRSRAVSDVSQHMGGKAMDIRLPDVDTARLRETAMKLQYGGVGYYSRESFVHVDTGSVRAWPRMTQEQLARLFPDGKTMHLPTNGRPLPRYEEARTEVAARKSGIVTASAAGPSIGDLFSKIFKRNDAAPAEPAGEAQPATAGVTVAEAAAPKVQLVAPLPPPRPAEAGSALAFADTAYVKVASADPSLVAPPEPQASATAAIDEGPVSPASRLLFSPLPVQARLGTAPARDEARPAVSREMIVEGPALHLKFQGAGQDELNTHRFAGPAIAPVPGIRRL